jgi:hypothetical protein
MVFPVELLERYRPDWVVGRGRTTVVWAVTDLESGRALALKWLRLTAMAQGWPRHPHFVEVVTQPRWDLLVMDRVRGIPLRDWPLPGVACRPPRRWRCCCPCSTRCGRCTRRGSPMAGCTAATCWCAARATRWCWSR